MDGGAATGSIYTNFQALNRLEAQAQHHDPAATKAAVQQFESLFIEMMLKSMRDATPKGGLFSSGRVRFFQNMMDHQVALDMARHHGVGLQPMLMKQLGGAAKPATAASKASAPARTAMAARPLVSMKTLPNIVDTAAGAPVVPAAGVAATPVQGEWPPKSASDFVKAVLPYARQAAHKLGVAARAIVAQAALESGWGKHTMRRPDGATSYNLFGVKAGHRWQGATVRVPTVEYKNGRAVRERADFRAYGSLAACFHDYVNFIQSHPRYHEALVSGSDPVAYVHALQKAGYATDPHYAAKIEAILNSGQLDAAGLKNSL